MTITPWLASFMAQLWLVQTSFLSPSGELPQFADSIPNVTVPVGREAYLECTVENLGNYKVAWIKLNTQTLLTIDTTVITRDDRIRSTNNNFRQWYLHIRDVKEDDRGYYMCQINTEPMINVKGFLDVQLPPTIQENGTSSDVIVNERSSVSLHCSATGYPKPKIFWRREDEKDINLGSFGTKSFSVSVSYLCSYKAAKVKGNFLNLTHITRTHMGAYLCIASNGIPPSVSKRIMLEVNFPPKIRVPNQVIGASPGSDVILECKVQAWPRPLTSWVRNENTLLLANSKYQLTEVYDSYNIDMKLKISNLQKEDFNAYKCGAKNAFGEKEGFIRLHPMATIQTPKKEEGRYIYNQPRSKELQGLINSSLSEKKNPNVPTTNSLTDKSHLSPSDRERKGSVEGASVEGYEKMNNDVGDKNLHQRSEYSNTSSITLVDRTSLVGLMWWIVYLWSLHL